MSTNINKNQVDDVFDNELKFESSNSLANNHVQDLLPMVTIRIIVGNKYRHTLNSGITFLWEIGSNHRMIERKHINPYKSKLRANKVEYNTASGPYKTTHDAKVPFSMPQFSNRKIITHCFHIGNTQGDTGIGYVMIIGHDLMFQLGLKEKFGRQLLEWGKTETTMK